MKLDSWFTSEKSSHYPSISQPLLRKTQPGSASVSVRAREDAAVSQPSSPVQQAGGSAHVQGTVRVERQCRQNKDNQRQKKKTTGHTLLAIFSSPTRRSVFLSCWNHEATTCSFCGASPWAADTAEWASCNIQANPSCFCFVSQETVRVDSGQQVIHNEKRKRSITDALDNTLLVTRYPLVDPRRSAGRRGVHLHSMDHLA